MSAEVPYQDRLTQIRTILEEVLTGFPKDWCSESVRVVGLSLGLTELIGYKKEIQPKGNTCCAYHVWNYDPERKLYVDLTHYQFGDYPKVLIFDSLDDFQLEVREGKNRFHQETVDKIITRLNQP